MRHVVNFFISSALIWVFQLIGWINVQADVAPFDNLIANQLLVSGVIGLMFTVYLWIAGIGFAFVIVASCGLGLLLFPIYYGLLGHFGFVFISMILPGWVVVDANFWVTALMGLMLAFIRWHEPSVSQTTNETGENVEG